MVRLHSVSISLLFATLALSWLAGCREVPSPAPRPDVLLYVIDTLRADSLATYGNSRVATPAADRLAREGVLFEDAVSNSAWTRAAMASAFTGLYPGRHGAQARDDTLPVQLPTLAEALQTAGYATAYINTNPNVGSAFGFARGFAELEELYLRRERGFVDSSELVVTGAQATRRAMAWIEQAERPWFLVVQTVDPHAPYRPPPEFDVYGGGYEGPLHGGFEYLRRDDLSAEEKRRMRSLYDGEVSRNDAALGELLGFLDQTGMAESTLVVLTADHGEEFWEYGHCEHGRSLNDPVIRVPLIFRWPADSRLAAASRSRRAAQLADLKPTLLDLLGLPLPEDLDGQALFGERWRERPTVSSVTLDGANLRATREWPWKLVADLDSQRMRLHRLDAPAAESRVAAHAKLPEAEAALERLQAALEAALAAEAAQRALRDTEREEAAELPAEVGEALRELGYVD